MNFQHHVLTSWPARPRCRSPGSGPGKCRRSVGERGGGVRGIRVRLVRGMGGRKGAWLDKLGTRLDDLEEGFEKRGRGYRRG